MGPYDRLGDLISTIPRTLLGSILVLADLQQPPSSTPEFHQKAKRIQPMVFL